MNLRGYRTIIVNAVTLIAALLTVVVDNAAIFGLTGPDVPGWIMPTILLALPIANMGLRVITSTAVGQAK